MSSSNEYLTVLFADITSSRQIFLALGDEKAHIFIAECLALLAEITTVHKGKVIKTIGDEVMSVFATSEMAVEAAVAMHKAMAEIVCPRGLSFKPGIHIGLEAGWVVSSENDVFGETVILASRLVAKAKTGQILTSGMTVEILPSEKKSMTRMIQVTSLKGLSQEVSIHEIIWEQKDLTVMMERPLKLMNVQHDFKLIHAGRTIVLNSQNPVITMGRHSSCDVLVDEIVVSRVHASIEHRSGKVFLRDQSTNGTFITFEQGKNIFVHREEVELSENGSLGLGRKTITGLPEAINFLLIETVRSRAILEIAKLTTESKGITRP